MKTMNIYAAPALHREVSLQYGANQSTGTAVDAALEFGRFRVLLRQRQLVADGAPVVLGTRAFDLLLALLEANGSLVSKDELVRRVWPGIVVAEENLKVQIFALRNALGEDRDFIRTEIGRGYRFTGAIRRTAEWGVCRHPMIESGTPHQRSVRQWSHWRLSRGRCDPAHTSGPLDSDHTEGSARYRD
jgi:DNA-binding winged helix-turn-helix (wHTH) protein